MNACDLLAELDAAGITVTREGDTLRVRGTPGVSLAPYGERLTAHKPALLAELLRVRIVAVLNVERECFDRPEYQRLLARWNAHDALAGFDATVAAGGATDEADRSHGGADAELHRTRGVGAWCSRHRAAGCDMTVPEQRTRQRQEHVMTMNEGTMDDRHIDDWPPEDGDYYGNCPGCGTAGIAYGIDRKASVLACAEHRIAWLLGSYALMKDGYPELSQEELERAYARNRARLREYRFIDPLQAKKPALRDEGPAMTLITTVCRECGTEFEPGREAIVAGSWRTCPACRPAITPPPDDPGSRCEICGRPVGVGMRFICLGCLTGDPAL